MERPASLDKCEAFARRVLALADASHTERLSSPAWPISGKFRKTILAEQQP
jgi:hypothetical protein